MKNLRQANQNLRKYILECINPENYDVKANTEGEKIKFLIDTFKSEYINPKNLKRYGCIEKVFTEWLNGLPSAFDIYFYNYNIVEKGKSLGFLSESANERQETIFHNGWLTRLTIAVKKLAKEHGLELGK